MPRSGWYGLIEELKRRKVFRVAVVYAGVGFVLAQAADIAFPALRLPEWTVTLVVVLVLLGFPLAIILAWAFEITPDGVVRTDHPGPGESSGVSDGNAGRPSGHLTALAGVLVLVVIVGALFVLGDVPQREATSRSPVAAAVERSIAVLPFTDLSPDGDYGWFSDGLTEDIQIHLAHVGDLKVIGHTSMMRYKGRDVGARQIGTELGVATVLAGSVRRAGNRIRVSVQLIQAATDEQLWAESYDQELTAADIFEIQSEVARQITRMLRARLSPEEDLRLARAPTDDLEAYDLYLRGREHTWRLTRADLTTARELFRQAIALDPDFALPYAGLGFAFAAMTGYHDDGIHWTDSAAVVAQRAVELDPGIADGHATVALVQWNRGHLEGGFAAYERALGLRPNDAESYWGMGFIRWHQGRGVEAVRLASRAVELDPGNPAYATLLGRTYATVGMMDRGEAAFRRALRLQPDFPWAHQDLLWILIGTGRYEEAEVHLRRIAGEANLTREFHQSSFFLALSRGRFQDALEWYDAAPDRVRGGIVMGADVAFVLNRVGEVDRAQEFLIRPEEVMDEIVGIAAEDFWPVVARGRAALVLGERDAGLTWLERAEDLGWTAFPFMDIAQDPILADLQGEVRFEEIRARLLDRRNRMRTEVEAEEERARRTR